MEAISEGRRVENEESEVENSSGGGSSRVSDILRVVLLVRCKLRIDLLIRPSLFIPPLFHPRKILALVSEGP